MSSSSRRSIFSFSAWLPYSTFWLCLILLTCDIITFVLFIFITFVLLIFFHVILLLVSCSTFSFDLSPTNLVFPTGTYTHDVIIGTASYINRCVYIFRMCNRYFQANSRFVWALGSFWKNKKKTFLEMDLQMH